EQSNYQGFDLLRRLSVRGDVFAAAVADILRDELNAKGPVAFHADVAQRIAYRPDVVSVLASANGALPVQIAIADPAGRTTGGVGANGKVTKAIPFSDLLRF